MLVQLVFTFQTFNVLLHYVFEHKVNQRKQSLYVLCHCKLSFCCISLYLLLYCCFFVCWQNLVNTDFHKLERSVYTRA